MRKSLLLAATLVFGLPAAWQAAAQNAPSVTVRAGAHPDFDRIVFDWPRNVHFELHRDGTQASITFDATADIKFTRDVQSYLTRAKAFSAKSENGHVIVSFTVRPDSTLKSFNGDGSSVVIDVSGKMAGAAMTDPAVQTPQVAARPLPSSPAKTPQTTPTPAPAAPIAAPLAKPVTAATPVALISALASPHPATTPTASPLTTLKNDAPPLVPPPVASPHNTLSDEPVLVATLDPHVPTRAAIFLRADIGYIVFDRKLTLSVAALENGTPSNVNIESFDMPRNSGYRFAVPPNAELHASLDGTVWKIFLSRKHPDAPVTTALVAQPDFALGARFLLPLPDAPDPIRMTDPVVGDDLILVPLAQSEAFNVQRYTANLTLLPAAQGLVIKPLTDKVIVRAVSDGVEITAEGGLLMSRAIDTGIISQSSSKAKAAASGKSIFDFATWAGKPGESFTETRQRLQQTIVDVPDAERNRARLELARFYFANGNGEEAAALLNFLLKQVPDLRSHSDFSALLGASEILAYHSEDGLHELSATALSDQPEIELWQAVGLAQMRDWPHAEEKFAARENVLTGYPEPFISRFFVMAIESAVATDKQHEATDWLDYIASAPHSEDIDPALAYLRGALHAKAGRAAAAEDSWKEAAASKDRLYQMRAELALIDLGVSTASLTPAQAADRLEALRFGWRGDDLEVDILHRLGTYYIEAKNVKQGLNALAQAVTLYPSSPLVPEIRAEMQAAFHNVFLGDLGKKISPLDSLTLFQQYRDLMPEGKDGDAVMRKPGGTLGCGRPLGSGVGITRSACQVPFAR